MRRRGFLGRLVAMVAAPVVAVRALGHHHQAAPDIDACADCGLTGREIVAMREKITVFFPEQPSPIARAAAHMRMHQRVHDYKFDWLEKDACQR